MHKKKREEGSCGSWMDTYADMVTLLLTFFIVLFSMSSVQQNKFEELMKSFVSPNGKASQLVLGTSSGKKEGPAQNQGDKHFLAGEKAKSAKEIKLKDIDGLYQYLKEYIKKNKMESSVSIEKGNQEIYIRFSNDMLFRPDNYQLTSKSKKTLSFLGKGLKSVEKQLKLISISGHTANTFDPNYPVSDWRLSSERAASVAIYLEDEEKINPKLIVTLGYGSKHPIADNKTAEGRKKNRRVEVVIIGDKSPEATDTFFYKNLKGSYDSSRYPANGEGINPLLPNAHNYSDKKKPKAKEEAAHSSSEKDTQSGENVIRNVSPYKGVPESEAKRK